MASKIIKTQKAQTVATIDRIIENLDLLMKYLKP